MLVRVKAKPNSRRANVEAAPDGLITVHLTSPPVDGRANEELIEVIAKHFDVPKSRVRIKSGQSSRTKLLEVLSPPTAVERPPERGRRERR